MKFLTVTKDGGEESTVWAYWLVEIKSLFSVAVLVFENGSRDAYHSHAFNCVSWLLCGRLMEEFVDGNIKWYWPSLAFPIITRRDTFHKVTSTGRSVVLTFRGPWASKWKEHVDGREITLTHGRKVVEDEARAAASQSPPGPSA